jgi:hypothetical protein
MLLAPLPNGIRYTEVHVLFLSWKDGTPEAMREIDELENVFSKLYRFYIHRHEINSQNPSEDTHAKVADFLLEKGNKDHLLILYFSGHTIPSHQENEAMISPA